jgi:hypothetical protein
MRWAWLLALPLAWACSDPVSSDPADSDEIALTEVMPDLSPEPGTVGTERYVPALERMFRRAVAVVREERGDDKAQELVDGFRRRLASLQDARLSGDAELVRRAKQELDSFAAGIVLRVFGRPVLRHAIGHATTALDDLAADLRTASAAGTDISALTRPTRQTFALLDEARQAAGADEYIRALVLAATVLDRVARISAAV